MRELEQIRPEFHESFQRFIETGEANEAFLQYMDTDEACQQAVDSALRKQAEEVRAFAEALRAPEAASELELYGDAFEEMLREIVTVAASVGSADETEIERAFEQHAAELPAIASALEKMRQVANRVLQRQDSPTEARV